VFGPNKKLEARLMAVLFLALFLGSIKPSTTSHDGVAMANGVCFVFRG